MTTIAEFSVTAASFPLGSVFERLANVTVELERIVPTDGAVIPHFWVYGAELDAGFEGFADERAN